MFAALIPFISVKIINIFHSQTPEETYLRTGNKANGAITPLTWSHLQQYIPIMDPTGFIARSRPICPFRIHVSVEEDHSVNWEGCVFCVFVRVCLPGLSTVAQSSVLGSLSFQGLLGSRCCWELVCPKSCPWTVKGNAARESLFRLTAIVEVRPAEWKPGKTNPGLLVSITQWPAESEC